MNTEVEVFEHGEADVLVCAVTLVWGVNLTPRRQGYPDLRAGKRLIGRALLSGCLASAQPFRWVRSGGIIIAGRAGLRHHFSLPNSQRSFPGTGVKSCSGFGVRTRGAYYTSPRRG